MSPKFFLLRSLGCSPIAKGSEGNSGGVLEAGKMRTNKCQNHPWDPNVHNISLAEREESSSAPPSTFTLNSTQAEDACPKVGDGQPDQYASLSDPKTGGATQSMTVPALSTC